MAAMRGDAPVSDGYITLTIEFSDIVFVAGFLFGSAVVLLCWVTLEWVATKPKT